jgi:hypothetical protein
LDLVRVTRDQLLLLLVVVRASTDQLLLMRITTDQQLLVRARMNQFCWVAIGITAGYSIPDAGSSLGPVIAATSCWVEDLGR